MSIHARGIVSRCFARVCRTDHRFSKVARSLVTIVEASCEPPEGRLAIGRTLESRVGVVCAAKLTLGGNDRSLTVTARNGIPSRDRKGAVMVGAATFISTPVRLALMTNRLATRPTSPPHIKTAVLMKFRGSSAPLRRVAGPLHVRRGPEASSRRSTARSGRTWNPC